MGNVLKNFVQNVDSQVDRTVKNCLSNSIILRRILKHFSNDELLELSLVNKFWNYEARSVLRERGTLVAYLVGLDDSDPYKNLNAFGIDLQRMNVVPFSGISIDSYHRPDRCTSSVLNPTLEAIISRLPLKYFSVRHFGNWCDCAVLLLIKRIFHHSSHVLETLVLTIDEAKEPFFQEIFEHCNFLSLKKLRLFDELEPADESYIKLIQALLSGAPNLQELHNRGNINLLGKLLEGRSAVLVCSHLVSAPFYEISDNVIAATRLEAVRLEYTGPEFDFERFNRVTPILLQACCTTTLYQMEVDAVLALPLMYFGVCLKNVTILTMKINNRQFQLAGILRLLKHFDFNFIFPNVVKVKVDPRICYPPLSLNHMNGIIEKSKAVLNQPVRDRGANIKKLCIEESLSSVNALFYAEMFPNIEKLEIREVDEADSPFGSIWKCWVNLTELKVINVSYDPNLDSLFCGIFPEEVFELRLQSKRYLKRVNIVPVMPAVTCLRSEPSYSKMSQKSKFGKTMQVCIIPDLRTLTLHSPNFSKVTKLIAFARSPGLTVKLKTIIHNDFRFFC